jgi:PAS domain S-box-containing protein
MDEESILNTGSTELVNGNSEQEIFKKILDITDEAFISLDETAKTTCWNAAAESMFGILRKEAIGKSIYELIVPQNYQKLFVDLIEKIYRKDQTIWGIQTYAKTGTGEMIEVLIKAFPVKNGSDLVKGSCFLIRNISKQVRAESQRREDSRFIGRLLETVPDIVSVVDLNTHLPIYSNRSIAAYLGYDRMQIAAMKNALFDIIFEKDAATVLEHLKKLKAGQNDDLLIEMVYRAKDAAGNIKWFLERSAVFKRNSRNVPVERISVTRDITDQKEEESEKLSQLQSFRLLEEISGSATWQYDIQTSTLQWSAGMYRLFNLPEGTAVTPAIYLDHAAPENQEEMKTMIANIVDNPAAFENTFYIVANGGEKKKIKMRAIVITDNENNPVKMIGVNMIISVPEHTHSGISGLKEESPSSNQEQIDRINELKLLNTITTVHYRETFQVLYTNLEYIISHEGRKLTDPSRANIRRAQSAIQRLKLLTEDINNYLQLYEIGAYKALIDPNEILNDLIESIQGKLVHVNATINMVKLPIIKADPYLFSQLMSRLLDNAIKFRNLLTPLVIKIKYAQVDEINAVPGALKNTPYVIISISDNGIGFDPENADRIFELFFKLDHSKAAGSGIGLAACKRIMMMHQGFIIAEGTAAHGATISCYFPLD